VRDAILALRRAQGAQAVIIAGAVAIAVAVGAGAAAAPPKYVLAALLALAVVGAVATHPPVAAYLLLALSPVLAGLGRGGVVPLLRPQEALAGLVGFGLVAHVAVRTFAGQRARLRSTFGSLDRALLALAVTGSIVPLIVMVVRDRPIVQDDVLYALQIWKYYAIFLIIRACIVTEQQVRRCLWIALCGSAVVALVAVLQVVHAPFVADHITRWYVDTESNQPLERGSSTLASPIAVGDVMVFSLAVALALLLRGDPRRVTLSLLSGLFVFGTLATGQFSAYIAFLFGVLAFGWITRRLSVAVVALTPVAGIAAMVLRPVIAKRLSGFNGGHTLPPSWQARLDNITTYFWPVLERDWNWLTGVRPLARVDGPAFSGIQYIWIESGHIWLLWTGGVPFAIAFIVFMWVALRSVGRVARSRTDACGVAGIAAFTALSIDAVLMATDPHLTLRGSADLMFALLALTFAVPAYARNRKSAT
jgi:hypothetical protein